MPTVLTLLLAPVVLAGQATSRERAVRVAIATAEADTLERIDAAPRSEERERAVRLAREGRYDEALAILRRLYRASPDDIPLRADLVTVLQWSGRDSAAVELGRGLPFDRLDFAVSEAVARAARNTGMPDLAVSLYGGVVERAADRRDSQIGLALALLEAGRVEEALAGLPALAKYPDDTDALLARAHVLREAGLPLDAAVVLDRALEIHPGDDEIIRTMARALGDLGAASLALDLVDRTPGAFGPPEQARIRASDAARWVEWAEIPSPGATFAAAMEDPAVRFESADRALARLDAALQRVSPSDGFAYTRLRLDRLIVLRERVRMEELLRAVEELEGEGVELPPYAQRMAADAALHLRDPEQAARRYRIAIEGWPENRESRLGLFYALVELDRHGEARRVISELGRSEPTYYERPGGLPPVPNPHRPVVEVASQLGLALARDLSAAQDGLEELREQAPMNLSVRQELGSVYTWRGWPRRAEAEFERILALEPDHIGARIGLANARLDMDERGTAWPLVDSLVRVAPENEHVRRLSRRGAAERAWAVSTEVGRASSTGGALGNRDRFLAARLGGPLAGRLEAFGQWRRSDAAYTEVAADGVHDRVSVGAAIRGRAGRVQIEASRNRLGSPNTGAALEIDLTPDDRWRLEARAESYTFEVPLQATLVGVDGWRVGGGLGHRAHEGRHWDVEAHLIGMSDGNRRLDLRASLEQDIGVGPRSRLAGRVALSAARNSLQGAPYFNPRRALAPEASLIWEWIPWRRYESRLVQRAVMTGGAYVQQDHGAEPVVALGLEHAWDLGFRVDFLYGVQWARPVYDGGRERRFEVHAGLEWRVR